MARDSMELARRLFPDGDLRSATELIPLAAKAEAVALERELLTSLLLPGALERSAERHRALQIVVGALLNLRRNPSLADLDELLGAMFGGGAAQLDRPFKDQARRDPVRLPGGDPRPAVLATIHRAKGREARRVFLLGADELAAGAKSEEDAESEANVLFVALTRSQAELILVESKPGAVAARLASSAALPARHLPPHAESMGAAGDRLSARWDDVLRLASVMHRLQRQARPALAWPLRQRGRSRRRLIIRA